MFVQNQIRDLKNHRAVVTEAFAAAGEARLIVAYVRENGVDMIMDGMRGKRVKLLCSLDMGITQLSGIRKLLENDAEVRVYKSGEGTFHPKVWLFKCGDAWKALVGSANLTAAALADNVEASVLIDDSKLTANAVMFFNYLWQSDNSTVITLDGVAQLEEQLVRRRAMRSAAPSAPLQQNEDAMTEKLFAFVKAWLDISKSQQQGISSLWRGWYIIPDQGYVDDALVANLAAYMRVIGDGVVLNSTRPDAQYARLLDVFVERSQFQRARLKLSPHSLFVRQAKNYLLKFGWAHHPLVKKGGEYRPEKRLLLPTALGLRVAACGDDIAGVRRLYSEYFDGYLFNGLAIVAFTRRLLERLGHLTQREFNYFVVHAYNEDDLSTVIDLVQTYRQCKNRAQLHAMIAAHFDAVKEHTAKNVRGNYDKKVRHTMSAIAWCDGFAMSRDFTIHLADDAGRADANQ